MTQESAGAMQDTLLYIEFGERRNSVIVEQPLSLLERQEFHNIATRHHGSVIESISRRMVISFRRADQTLACARDLRSNVQMIRTRAGERMGLYCRMLLLPAPPGVRDTSVWAEMALKLSLHLNNAPINGITAIEPYLKLLQHPPLPTPRVLPAINGSRISLFLLAYEDSGGGNHADTHEGMTRGVSPLTGAGVGLFADLKLRIGEQMRIVHPPECPITVGRSKACGLVLQGDSVSRMHGRIEFDNEKFYYLDESRNSTYVLTHDGTEVKVSNERILLVGDGVISPGMPVMKQTGQVIRFNCNPIRLDFGGGSEITKPR
ncbi:MAG: FHA domain-containing protein [Pseudomonadota bacterium]